MSMCGSSCRTTQVVCERPADSVALQEKAFVTAIHAATAKMPGLRVIHPSAALCNKATCLFVVEGQAAYSDKHHLSQAGEEVVFRAFAADFKWALGSGDPAVSTSTSRVGGPGRRASLL